MAKKTSVYKTDSDRYLESLSEIGRDIGELQYVLGVISNIQTKEQFKLEAMHLLITSACELLIEKNILTESELKNKVLSLTKLLQKEKRKQMKKYKEQTKEAYEKSLLDSNNVGHA